MDQAVACRVLTVTIGVKFNASYPSILSCECILLLQYAHPIFCEFRTSIEAIYPFSAPAICLILLHTNILLITYQRTTEDTELSNQSGEGSRQQTTVNDDTTTVLAKAEMPTTDYDTPPSNSASKQALGSCRHLIVT